MHRAGLPSSDEEEEEDYCVRKKGPLTVTVATPSTPSPQRRKFEMVTPGGKLAQEIHDEFLVCKICLEGYKSPKSLNCLHTFCEQCIDSHVMSESTYKKYSDYREFTCPLCRKRTSLPLGGVRKLPDNFLVSSLLEIVGRSKPSKYPFCDICKLVNRKHREAASKCLDCAKLLCVECVQMHRDTKVTSNHSIFDIEIEKDIECKEHQDEVVRFYCEPCQTCICVLCTFNEHKDHEITQFKEAVAKYKENIQTLLSKCEGKIDKFDSQLEALSTCENIIKLAEQKIHDTAIHFISEVRNKEKQLIEEVENLYGRELMTQITKKSELSLQVDGFRNTCKLTEVILKGKDIELLLLKKDVEEKLHVLDQFALDNPPETVQKKINYVNGDIDLGYIQDMDRPALTTPCKKKPGELAYGRPRTAEKLCQTEGSPPLVIGKTKKEKSKRETSDDEDDESGSDVDSEEETDDDTDDELGGKKKECVDSGMQTEQTQTSDSSSGSDEDESGPEMADDGTMTDTVPTEEKAVNTRSRSMLGGSRRTDDEDGNLAARRRRRRGDRAQTAYIGNSLDADRRGQFRSQQSLDEEVYYDADGRQVAGQRV